MQVFAFLQEASDLFAPLGEELADKVTGRFREENRLLPEPEMKQERIDSRDRIEAGAGDFMHARPFVD